MTPGEPLPILCTCTASRVSARKGASVHAVHMHNAPVLPRSCGLPAIPSPRKKVVTTTEPNDRATIHIGDARTVLASMPEQSADSCTSPPYGPSATRRVGQYGLEPSPPRFREAGVLAVDGTCWLNLGDSYSAGGATASGLHQYIGAGLAGRQAPGLGTKNLLGLPWRTALALQDDGWILRNAIVWHKPNAMPESVRDRLNCRHELIFLMVRSRHYWFDLDPIRLPHATAHPAGGTRPPGAPATGRHPGDRRRGGTRPQKYGPHTRQVIAARRYGTGRGTPGAPQRPQPRRRLVDPHPPLPRAALRRVPGRDPAPLHPGRVQTGRHGTGSVLRHRHYRYCRPGTWSAVHRHRDQPRLCRACGRTAAACRRSPAGRQ